MSETAITFQCTTCGARTGEVEFGQVDGAPVPTYPPTSWSTEMLWGQDRATGAIRFLVLPFCSMECHSAFYGNPEQVTKYLGQMAMVEVKPWRPS